MTTKNKIGCVNPCGIAHLYDANNKCIGTCLDTPNSFAVAVLTNKKVAYAKTYYKFFGYSWMYANDADIIDRVKSYKKYGKAEQIAELKQFTTFY